MGVLPILLCLLYSALYINVIFMFFGTRFGIVLFYLFQKVKTILFVNLKQMVNMFIFSR